MAGFRFPAGTQVAGGAVGGQFASAAAFRQARIGNATLTSRFPSIIGGLQIRANAASEETAEVILEDARAILLSYRGEMPNWTGELYDGYYVFHGDLVDDYFVATEVEHAPFVEFGSVHNQPPRPHLIPAIEKNKAGHIARVAASLRGL